MEIALARYDYLATNWDSRGADSILQSGGQAVTLLSRKADYALLILSYLHQKMGTARAIAEKLGLGRSFVANILKELCHHGFVDGHRGVKGGYTLARPAATITLAELLEVIEEGFRLTMCNTTEHEHENCSLAGTCTLKGPIAVVHHRLLEVLRGVTLAELFDPTGLFSQPSALHALPLLMANAPRAVETPLA
jgi:Rrf2 family transcriptional regulator, cysteine metabolism repressor